jgi:hypothetical protein
MREIKLALLPAGTPLPPFKPVADPPMQVQVPEPWWNDAWRNGVYQVKKVHSYWQCTTEAAHQVRIKNLLGLHDQAAKEEDAWLKLPGVMVEAEFLDADGNFHHGQGHDWCSSGGTTGMHLFNQVEHYLMTRDKEWFQKNLPRIQKAADWLIRQRNSYMKDVPNRKDLWCAGLQPPAASSESWGANRLYWYYYIDVVTCEALDIFADALSEVQPEKAAAYKDEVQRYRADIRRCVERSIDLSPVRRLRTGAYRSFIPGACYFRRQFGGYNCEDMAPTPQLASLILSPQDKRLAGMLEIQEDAFLFLGFTKFLSEKRREKGLNAQEDWFWGGISQQVGWFFLTDAHLICDDVPAFLRSWVNNYAAFVSPTPNGEYFFAEGFPRSTMCGTGGYPNGNSAAYFMRNFRNLLVMEMGDALWLAKATPRHWLEQGKSISVKNAPTYFGTVAYEIVSDVDNGKITATVEMPSRKAPKEVVLRLRHPKAAPIKSVTINGKEWKEFTKDKETITLTGLTGTAVVTARY